MSGIAQYVRETRPWSVHVTERTAFDAPPPWLESWQGDGIITRIGVPEIRDAIRRKSIPIIDLHEQLGGMGVPQITNDHVAIGRMAANHLLTRKYERFAFIGYSGHKWSDDRGKAFADLVREKGYPCEVFNDRRVSVHGLKNGDWEGELDEIANWITTLQKPIGVFVAHDFRAVQLLNACRQANVAVPERASVVGVGADEVACQFSDPPLSSIILNAWKMGYEAAALLDRQMRGEAGFQKEMLIPPLDVYVRQSSDVNAINDPLVASALQFIRENIWAGINVEAVLDHLDVSRTTLQNHFRSSLGQSIHDVVIDARLARVKELLIETSLSVADISERCGFRHPEYMTSILKKRTGWTPARYREQYGTQIENPYSHVPSSSFIRTVL